MTAITARTRSWPIQAVVIVIVVAVVVYGEAVVKGTTAAASVVARWCVSVGKVIDCLL